MKIKFWGIRGSLPISLNNKQILEKMMEVLRLSRGHSLDTDEEISHFLTGLSPLLVGTSGGNTSCFEITSSSGTTVIVDMGSGVRGLGNELMKKSCGQGKGEVNFVMTHTHWDHIMGFPFFIPAYISGNNINIYGVHKHIEQALTMQGNPICFPVQLKDMNANIHFHYKKEGEEFQIGDIRISSKALEHPGGSYAYRFTDGDKSIVIATDGEYKNLTRQHLQPFIDFYSRCDLLLFDAQYLLSEALFSKVDWGHSSAPIGIDLGILARVKQIALIHHDPTSDDTRLASLERASQDYLNRTYPDSKLNIIMAREELEMTL